MESLVALCSVTTQSGDRYRQQVLLHKGREGWIMGFPVIHPCFSVKAFLRWSLFLCPLGPVFMTSMFCIFLSLESLFSLRSSIMFPSSYYFILMQKVPICIFPCQTLSSTLTSHLENEVITLFYLPPVTYIPFLCLHSLSVVVF